MGTYMCEGCGKAFESSKSLSCHKATCSSWKSYKKPCTCNIFCENCGKPLTEVQASRGYRFCSHKCHGEKEGKAMWENTLSKNYENPRYTYKQLLRFGPIDQAYLYFVRFADSTKVGITHNIYKRLNELFRDNNCEDFEVLRVMKTDPLLVAYAETFIHTVYRHDHEYHDINDTTAILNAIDNIIPWMVINGYTKQYPEILEESHHIGWCSFKSYSECNKEFYNKHGVNISKGSFLTIDNHEVSDDIIMHPVKACEDLLEPDHLFTLNDGLITHNCRLRLDLRELSRKGGGLFGANDSTGSIGVVTINLPRIAYLAKKEYPDSLDLAKSKFYKTLSEYMDLASESLELKRDYIQKNVLEEGLIPAYKEYVGTLDNHFSTIGLVGMNEMCVNLLGVDIVDETGKSFCLEVLAFMREKLSDYQEHTGHLYNLEATPAESTCYRLARKDKEDFGDDIFTQFNGDPYYTNSCHMPVKDIQDLKQLFDHQDDLQCMFTGGTVVHMYLDGPINGEQAKSIVKSVCTNYKLPYISLSPLVTTCPDHGLLYENADHCPKCGKLTDHWQRITGYIRRINKGDVYFWNAGKVAEFKDRAQLKTKGGLTL